jgi:hypothetical protein
VEVEVETDGGSGTMVGMMAMVGIMGLARARAAVLMMRMKGFMIGVLLVVLVRCDLAVDVREREGK